VVLEAGCGVGNTIFPLIKLNPDKYCYVFDFSPSAIDILKRNPEYNEANVTAFVCDPTNQEVPTSIVADNSVDIAVMVFFLSAVDPDKMNAVLSHIYKTLKPGGVVIIRDYGMYDMTQMRFINKRGRKLGENFYMRADGTRTYFFSKENLESRFNQVGFTTSIVKYNTRELRNRKRKLSMYRVWISGRFVKPATS
jgi:methyltransferase-like protein 6